MCLSHRTSSRGGMTIKSNNLNSPPQPVEDKILHTLELVPSFMQNNNNSDRRNGVLNLPKRHQFCTAQKIMFQVVMFLSHPPTISCFLLPLIDKERYLSVFKWIRETWVEKNVVQNLINYPHYAKQNHVLCLWHLLLCVCLPLFMLTSNSQGMDIFLLTAAEAAHKKRIDWRKVTSSEENKWLDPRVREERFHWKFHKQHHHHS